VYIIYLWKFREKQFDVEECGEGQHIVFLVAAFLKGSETTWPVSSMMESGIPFMILMSKAYWKRWIT
jgi:hypothetical protein